MSSHTDSEAPLPSGQSPTQTGLVYRDACPADAATIREILVEAHLSIPAPGDLERVTQSRIGEIFSVVCERDSEVVGVLQWRNLGEEAEILDLAVRASRRRQGHAGFLLENFRLHAAAGGVRRIFLEVRESNAPAIALYGKFAFHVTGRRPHYYLNPDEAALLMRRVLPG